jgi:hypothetical protein
LTIKIKFLARKSGTLRPGAAQVYAIPGVIWAAKREFFPSVAVSM